MKFFFISLFIHFGLLFFSDISVLKKDYSFRPRVESSSEVIHVTIKLNESEVRELEKKIDIIKKEKIVNKVTSTIKKKFQQQPIKKSTVVQEGVSKVKGDELLNKYFLELRKHIEAKKYYPKMALMLKQAGSVEICLEIDQNGNFHGIHIKRPSPFSSLNKAALSLVEEISKFKPLPLTMGKKVTLNIPLKYDLSN
ncbi:MAG: energy transducer TonB [Bacteriovoracaceae bacterium]|nr:energy transducer TonB [Bacteriovoracaceae bacterium]